MPKYNIQDSPDQCPMPINVDRNHGIDRKCLSMPIIADQCRSIPINSSQCQSMPDQGIIKTLVKTVNQCRINYAWSGIDWHWSALIAIDRHWDQCQNFDRHWSALGIDQGSPEYIKCLRASDMLDDSIQYPPEIKRFPMLYDCPIKHPGLSKPTPKNWGFPNGSCKSKHWFFQGVQSGTLRRKVDGACGKSR